MTETPVETPGYIQPAVIKAMVTKWSDQDLLRIWRHFNVKAEWPPTIKYPHGDTEKLVRLAREYLSAPDYVDNVVSWGMRSTKIWSIEGLARFVVRLAFARALSDVTSPAPEPVTVKIVTPQPVKTPTKMSARNP